MVKILILSITELVKENGTKVPLSSPTSASLDVSSRLRSSTDNTKARCYENFYYIPSFNRTSIDLLDDNIDLGNKK